MAMLKTVVVAFCALSFSGVSATSGFLKGIPTTPTKLSDFRSLDVVNSELQEALAEVMGSGHGVAKAQLDATAAKIKPTFDSLPKNVYGHIGRDALRYLVHRYFVSEHGWSIKGFEPHGPSMNSSDACVTKVLKQKLPSYIESILEHKLAHHGFAATDVVTMVATLERMIFDEGVEMLEKAYQLNGEKTASQLTEERVQEVMRSFMLIYAMQSDRENVTAHSEDIEALRESFPEGWAPGDFANAETKAHLEATKAKNPFATSNSFSFEVASQAVTRIGEGFGKFQNQECKELKHILVSMDRQGTGRVSLKDFYSNRENPAWIFQETPDYLRNLGALDEASAKTGPMLLIPNYVNSMSNCLEPSDYYSICCLNECEGILGSVEAELRAPLASPAQITEVVQRLLSSADSPRNLTAQLIAKLDTVAERHHGKVPIHGRLFSQWLHYVFPQECPFPQLSEGHNPLTASEWMNQGKDIMLSDDELEDIVDKSADASTENLFNKDDQPLAVEQDLSLWTMDEELYVGHHHEGRKKGWKATIFQPSFPPHYVLGGLSNLGIILGMIFALKSFVEQNMDQLQYVQKPQPTHQVSTSKDLFV